WCSANGHSTIRNTMRAPCPHRPVSMIYRACVAPILPAPGPGTAFMKTACARASTLRLRSARRCRGGDARRLCPGRCWLRNKASTDVGERITTLEQNGPPPQAVGVLYPGEGMHARLKPFGHRFTYRVFSL